MAEVPCKVTGGFRPLVDLVPGRVFAHAQQQNGRRVYCVGLDHLPGPEDPRTFARALLEYLAYAFLDYGAREIVSRFNRTRRRGIVPPR